MVANVEEKNVNARKIIEFINGRIKAVESELGDVEDDIEKFRKTQNFTAPEKQADLLYANTDIYYKELSEYELKREMLDGLQESVKQAGKDDLIPTTLFTDNESLVTALVSYNELLSERKRKLSSYKEENPAIKSIDEDLKNKRGLIENNIKVVKRSLDLKIKELKEKSGIVSSQILKVPEKERVYVEKTRKQAIYQSLFVLLLTKREETAVTAAATTPNITVINEASNQGAIYPNKSKVKNRALLLGFLIPMIFFSVRRLLNNKIIARSDIEQNSDITVLGEIGHYKDMEDPVAVKRNSNTALSEQFRGLRTNIQFLLPDKQDNVIMFTSKYERRR